jgi:hypothetical protein
MASHEEPIRGKVAKVLSRREVVLNLGKAHNVEIGMVFDILFRGYDEITDPDTGEVLGGVDRPKARVKVITANEKLSIATTYRTERVNVGGSGGLGIRLRGDLNLPTLPRWETRVETFDTEEAPHEGWDEHDRLVSAGDPVVQVIVPESEIETAVSVSDVDDLPF